MPTPFVVNAGFRGDFIAGATIDFNFTTTDVGVPFALAGTPAVSVYKDSSLTQSTAGVTLTASFDSVTGLNHVTIDTSSDGTFYAAGHQFDVVITTGTVNAGSVVGYVVGSFSTRAGAANGPTIAGSNAATTYATLTVTGATTLSDGLAVSRSSSNASAITATGNGTGSGIVATSGSGATGDGIQAVAASTNGNGLKATGIGTGSGVVANSGAGATGNGITATALSTNGNGIAATPTGTGAGLSGTLGALSVTTYAESSAVPSATDTLLHKLNWLATLGRNKITNTSSQQKLLADDNSTVVGTSTVSDDGATATRGKFA